MVKTSKTSKQSSKITKLSCSDFLHHTKVELCMCTWICAFKFFSLNKNWNKEYNEYWIFSMNICLNGNFFQNLFLNISPKYFLKCNFFPNISILLKYPTVFLYNLSKWYITSQKYWLEWKKTTRNTLTRETTNVWNTLHFFKL